MKRFIEGADRHQVTRLPECLDDYVDEDNPVPIVGAFANELNLGALASRARIPQPLTELGITRQFCSNSTSTTTSIASSPAADWNARPNATSSSCGWLWEVLHRAANEAR